MMFAEQVHVTSLLHVPCPVQGFATPPGHIWLQLALEYPLKQLQSPLSAEPWLQTPCPVQGSVGAPGHKFAHDVPP